MGGGSSGEVGDENAYVRDDDDDVELTKNTETLLDAIQAAKKDPKRVRGRWRAQLREAVRRCGLDACLAVVWGRPELGTPKLVEELNGLYPGRSPNAELNVPRTPAAPAGPAYREWKPERIEGPIISREKIQALRSPGGSHSSAECQNGTNGKEHH